MPVLGVALALGVLMFFLYRRELRFHTGAARWLLPLLRSLAVVLAVLCLAGPILRHIDTYRQLGRVVLVADASASMSFSDDTPQAGKPPAPAPAPALPAGSVASSNAGTRFDRMETALLDPNHSMVKKLAEKHDVELFALRGYRAERLWWHRQEGSDVSGDLPHHFEFKPEATATNLDQPLRDALGPNPAGTALVILTDGQHNGPGSPEEMAAGLRDSGIPVFTVGYGSELPPPDLAILNVQMPEAVFAEDRAEGTLVISDTLPAGLGASMNVLQGSKVLWQQTFTTTGAGERRFDFSFPVRDLVGDPKQSLRTLTARVDVNGVNASQDKIANNNSQTLSLHLLSRKRRVLLLDGRPRWETRYIHNHFDRDERWDVVAAFDTFTRGQGGQVAEAFPKTKDDLMNFDLIILGDLRPDALSEEQQSQLVEFVEKRGGGLIFIDGRRNHLQAWQSTKAATLIPVKWKEQGSPAAALDYSLTEQGQTMEALRLSDSPSTNPNLWTRLPKPFWVSPAEPLPDAAVLAKLGNNTVEPLPALVWRRFGAGSVVWLGTDELWRWRYEVADQHHQRFWMQVATWVAAPPFMVENDRLSLGTDRLRYQEGDTAELRVRLRTATGTTVTEGSPRAHVFRNGLEIASLELAPDPSHGGVFRAITGTLPAGDYQLSVSEGSAPAHDLRLGFRVESQANKEWSQLTLNRPLLEGMARVSQGRFLREGDISQLPDLLQQLDRMETRTTETKLWHSWWWFGAVMLLLTLEWILRKVWRLV